MQNLPKIGVLGGSFNPPTLAHKILLTETMQKLNLNKGIFVPSSHNYVTRKMKRVNGHVYSQVERYNMLSRIADDCKESISVSPIEFNDDGRGHTYQTLDKLRAELQRKIDKDPFNMYDTAIYRNGFELCFLVGTDKLDIIPRWGHSKDLLEDFMLIVVLRGTDSESVIKNRLKKHPFYWQHMHRLMFVKLDTDVTAISSTKVRQMIQKQASWSDIAPFLDETTVPVLQRIHRDEIAKNKISLT